MPNNQQPLYGSIPYVLGINANTTSSLLWVNAAHTYVTITDQTYNNVDGSYVSFSSEVGVVEFYIFATQANSAKLNRVQKAQLNLATISGFVPLPQRHTLGFHFCKWNNISADMLVERSKNFTMYGFPLDVAWMDIEWAD